jgi:hypothetical protein
MHRIKSVAGQAEMVAKQAKPMASGGHVKRHITSTTTAERQATMAKINIPQQACDKPRWRATVQYRFDAGTRCVTHDLEEINELHDLVDQGPHGTSFRKSKFSV